tara:strand:+ start:2285 stop:3664 length:1380 start_codon:yes stop_codon:yes gene_type:complete
MLKIYIPSDFQELNLYSAKIIFDEILGIKYELNTHAKNNIEIHKDDSDKIIILSSIFTDVAKNFWLNEKHIPTEIKNFSLENPIFESLKINYSDIPILFGENNLEIRDNYIKMDVDIFGTVFFMLSRYEELFSKKLDIHNRFRLEDTIAYKNNFLNRPIVNEYTEILWLLIKNLWPSIQRKKRKYKSIVSCDVDHPFDEATDSILRISRRVIARVFRDRNIELALSDLKYFLQKKIFGKKYDNYTKNIYWMMDLAESKKIKLQFNFIPINTDSKYDTKYTLEDPDVVKVFKDIQSKKHFVGIHPGYNSSVDEEIFTDSVEVYKKLLNEYSISNKIYGRQHYLKFIIGETVQLWEDNQFFSDSSMGYSNAVGFRSGICHEYSMFNFKSMSIISTKQVPLIVMDCAIFNDNIYNEKKLNKIQNLINTCKIYDGSFTILWHNSYFSNKKSKKYYENILDLLQ